MVSLETTQSAASMCMRMLMCEMLRSIKRSESLPSWRMYSYTVTRFSPSWLPFSFSVGPVDSVENPSKNTAF